MAARDLIVEGEIKTDGTLAITEPLPLQPGPVRVIIQPLPARGAPGENWWQRLLRARAEAEARGGPFLTDEEIQAERKAFRTESS